MFRLKDTHASRVVSWSPKGFPRETVGFLIIILAGEIEREGKMKIGDHEFAVVRYFGSSTTVVEVRPKCTRCGIDLDDPKLKEPCNGERDGSGI
jgi:hypothetical protein